MASSTDYEVRRGNVIGKAERVARAAADIDADVLVGCDGDISMLSREEYPIGVNPGDMLAEPLFRKLAGLRYDTGTHVPLGGGDPHAIGEEEVVAILGLDGVLVDIMHGVASLPHDQRRERSAEAVAKLASEHRLSDQSISACEQFAVQVAQVICDAAEPMLAIVGRGRSNQPA